ncbi:MAG: radical SAM protein [Kiritimatiellaeota bacterium]|nr:radical SAM protein [Kiritimatiellota bacterium]
MSRILLIQAPHTLADPMAHRTELLGIEYLAASLRKDAHEVSFYDPTLAIPICRSDGLHYYGCSESEIAERIKAFAPDIVGISCHHEFAALNAYRVAEIAKQNVPNVVTIMGGLFVSTFIEKPLQDCQAVDFGMIGEADETFPEFAKQLSSGKTCHAAVDGLIWREGYTIQHKEKTRYIEDLDTLPFPARDLVDMRPYMTGCTDYRLCGLGFQPALSLLTSRSCPNRCSFCNMRLVHGPRWRGRSPENVIAELDEILNKHHASHVFVMDDNFTLRIERAKRICELIIQRGYRFHWNTPNGVSVKGVDAELASLMKRSGCVCVSVAIESGSEYIRTIVMNKKTARSEITNAIGCFVKEGIPVVGYVVIGMPGENEHHFMETVKLLKTLPLTSLCVSFAVPFPGTVLFEQLVKDGILHDGATVEMDDEETPCFETADFTKKDLLRRRDILKSMFPRMRVLCEIVEGLCTSSRPGRSEAL